MPWLNESGNFDGEVPPTLFANWLSTVPRAIQQSRTDLEHMCQLREARMILECHSSKVACDRVNRLVWDSIAIRFRKPFHRVPTCLPWETKTVWFSSPCRKPGDPFARRGRLRKPNSRDYCGERPMDAG